MGDVWKLENENQDFASECINNLYKQAVVDNDTDAKNLLIKLYDDNWETIQERMETEGSVWYVWYMDGVNKYVEVFC